MKFSILVANFNNAQYIETCFQSILNQTYQDFEVIIVDDASSDNSLDVIELFMNIDKRFKLFRNDKNMGCGFTKSKCIDLANGEILGFLDPDDALTETALEDMTKMHERFPNIVAVYSQFMKCDENLKPKEVFEKTKQMPPYQMSFFNWDIRVAHFFTFKKKAYLKTSGMNTRMRVSEDQDLYLKLYETGDFLYVPQPLYLYRLHATGVSQNENRKTAKEAFLQAIMDAIERRGLSSLNGRPIPKDTNELKLILNHRPIWKRILNRFK